MTWKEYKTEIKRNDPYTAKTLEESEKYTEMIFAIIRKRNEMGISQKELAGKCGIHQKTIARIENLKLIPKMDTFFRIMNCLGIEIILTYA